MLTTNFVPGAPNWVDLGAPDVAAAADFYGALFGWEFQSAGPDAGGYGMLTLNGKVVAAAGPGEEGTEPAWTIYFQVADADATAAAVRKAGGSVRSEPMDVFTAGRMAQFTDPTGAQFAVWQPGDTKGLEAVTEPGTLTWTELHTVDVTAAKAFYNAVFGWNTEDMPMGDFTYTVVAPAGGGEKESQGGMMQLTPEMAAGGMVTRWVPYFEVEDPDGVAAEATKRGGIVAAGPQDIEGVGRFAVLVDPAGAPFSIIKSAS